MMTPHFKKYIHLWIFSYLDCRNFKKYLCHFVPKVVSNSLYEDIGKLTVIHFANSPHAKARVKDTKCYKDCQLSYLFI